MQRNRTNPVPSRILVPWLFLALFVALDASATVMVPDVVMRAEVPKIALREGSAFSIPVDVYVASSAVLEDVRVRADQETDDLRFVETPALARTQVPRGFQHFRHVLEGTLEPGLDEVRLQVTANGEVWEERLRLRSIGDAEVTVEPSTLARGQEVPILELPPSADLEALPSGYPTAESEGLARRASRTVQATGRVLMRVNDSGAARAVEGATVYFMQVRGILDDLEIGRELTDGNGFFTINGEIDGTHDVYIKVRAENSRINIGTDAGFQTYGRNVRRVADWSGVNFFAGDIEFADSMNHALYLTTMYTRAYQWFSDRGYNLPGVNCRWPDDGLGSSIYLPFLGLEGIHLRSDATWQSDTIIHEYGHHFVAASPLQEVFPPYYLNGICDPSHCGTCRENEAVAWSEGVPHFLQQEINTAHQATYGWLPPGTQTFETVGDCQVTGAIEPFPRKTEFWLAAFLNDLIDTNPDEQRRPGIVERSELLLADILYVAGNGRASDSIAFFEDMQSHVYDSGLFDERTKQEFWAAAAVNGFDFDSTPPFPPTSIDVPTHPLIGPAPSRRPEIRLSGATDDRSGVAGYRVRIAPTLEVPDTSDLYFSETDFEWPVSLGTGVWTITVASVDRAGNQSIAVGTRVIEVGPALPVDLALVAPGLWEADFLVRNDATVTGAAGAVDTDLPHDADLWVSLTAANDSPAGAEIEDFSNRVYLDGSLLTGSTFPDTFMSPNEEYQTLNAGPFQLAGGRHHFGILLDQEQRIAEDDRDNNRVDRYVVIRPPVLAPGSWQIFPEPPRAFTQVGSEPALVPNVAGHRVFPVNDFAAVLMSTADTRTDYDLWAYEAATDWQNGFTETLATSRTNSTDIEVVVINRNDLGDSFYDFGVERKESGILRNYTMRHVTSQTPLPGDDTTVNWSDQDNLELLEYTFTVAETGPFSIRVTAAFEPADAFDTIDLFWMEPGDETLSPLTDDPATSLTGTETGVLELQVANPGTYCLVLHRRLPLSSGAARVVPGELERAVAQPVAIEVRTDGNGLPDLTIFRDNQFWDLPFIPSFEPLPGPKAGIPSFLTAEGASTYLNFALTTIGLPVQTDFSVQVRLDGLPESFFVDQSVPSQNQLPMTGPVSYYGTTPVSVPGGRHTLVLDIDPYEQVQEFDETNNTFATQFGWEGPELLPFSNVTAGPPPDPTAGREFFEVVTRPVGTGGEESLDLAINEWHVNSDGYRIPAILPRANDGDWLGVATMPTANSDVDVRIHEVLPPARAFGPYLASSGFGIGESDFVLVDLKQAPAGPFDVSVTNQGGSDQYTLVQVRSSYVGKPTAGTLTYGPFAVDGGGFLSLYEFSLESGTYEIELLPQSSEADMGISVFPPSSVLGLPYYSKDQGNDLYPMSYDAPPGQVESVTVDVDFGQEGRYCVAVWKVGGDDLQANQDFSILFKYQPKAPPCVAIDGMVSINDAYGPAKSVQTVQTAFGDADLGQTDSANGSELDQLFAVVCDDVLYITLAGNLESNSNDLELFLDTKPGGQNRLLGIDDPVLGDRPSPFRMGDDGSGNGLTFEPGFEADYYFGVQGSDGEHAIGMEYRLFAYTLGYTDTSIEFGHYLGATVPGAAGILAGASAENPHGIKVSIDNSNTAGVSAGVGASSGAGVVTGVEWAIPLAAIGNPTDCIRVVAFVNGKFHDFVSNQFLPPLPVGTENLGEPRDLDLGAIGGTQYLIVCQGTSTDVDMPVVPVERIALHAPTPNPFNPRTTLSFSLPRESAVELTLYDVAGRLVRRLVSGEVHRAGRHEFSWDGTDDNGRRVASGAYLVRLRADGDQQVRRLTLLK